MGHAPVLAFHWGGKALRGWAMSRSGKDTENFEAGQGLADAKPVGYAASFADLTRSFRARHPGAPILIAGMAGARGVWIESPYAMCPLQPDDLIRQAQRFEIDGHPAMILPGATCRDARGNSDVMRGEEVQLIGITQMLGPVDAVVSIPGKHCKIAMIRRGVFEAFRSFITGELFELLSDHSLVGALAEPGDFDEVAFGHGVEHGAATPLATAVFASRANTLQGDLAPNQVKSFLSGVLIGHEAAQLKALGRGSVILLASGVLADRYAAAFGVLGLGHEPMDAGACMKEGLRAISARLEVVQ